MTRNRAAFLALALMLAGCSSFGGGGGGGGGERSAGAPTSGPATPQTRTVTMSNGEEGELVGPDPAPGSKFAKVKLNMSRRQVENLIGPPDDETGHITGKAFIPFFFGGDTHRTEALYKGEGQLTYAPRNLGAEPNQLVKMEVNPNATDFSE